MTYNADLREANSLNGQTASLVASFQERAVLTHPKPSKWCCECHNHTLVKPKYFSLLQQPGPKKFKLFKIELIYRAKKFRVPPFTI